MGLDIKAIAKKGALYRVLSAMYRYLTGNSVIRSVVQP